MTALDRDSMRILVREAIRDALAQTRRAPQGDAREAVRIASDADLAAFVRRLGALMADPASAARLASGEHRFTLAHSASQPSNMAPPAVGTQGAEIVSEKTVSALPEGATLRLAPGAVVTPLARDRARARRITLERTR